MSFKQGNTLYATGSVDLNTTADPSTSKVIKQFAKGDTVGEIYGVYPFSDKSGVAYSVDGGYVYDSDPITTTAPSAKPAAGMLGTGSDLYTTSAVNFRDGASTTANVLFEVEPGYVGTITGYAGDGTWYAVTDSDGDKGYVKQGSYLYGDAASATAASKKSGGGSISADKKTSGKKPKNYTQIFTWVIAAGLAVYGAWWYFVKRNKKEKAK